MIPVSPILIPADEPQRLGSIRQYDVVHSLQEPVFGEFVALTARIFSSPISLIALVDETQVQYTANVGLPTVTEQAREEALCATTILSDKAVIYTDLATETSPLITQRAAAAARSHALRFYAAAPIRTPDERRIGSLCVADHHPRLFNPAEQLLLEQIATLVSQMVTVRYCCFTSPSLGETQWQQIREQIQEELQALVALVRYLITRHGTQVPISQDMLTLVSRRLNDLRDVLDEYET